MFLNKFHERNKQSILDNNIEIYKDELTGEEYFLLKRTKHYIPSIPKLGNLNLNKIKNSKYIIT
jgi:hypothetical protein